MANNIVAEWLRSLHLGQYAESFIDNGYDDLEICKQVGDPDLDAIGVFNPIHRSRLLQSVRTLREEGAASVYFTLEETTSGATSTIIQHDNECLCDNVSARSSRGSCSGGLGSGGVGAGSGGVTGSTGSVSVNVINKESITRLNAGSPAPSSSGAGSGQELAARYLDEYEEGKAELVKIPRVQLKVLLREKLQQDGIRLSCQPYSNTVSDLLNRFAKICPCMMISVVYGTLVKTIFVLFSYLL